MSFSGYFSVKPAKNFVPAIGSVKRKARKFQSGLALSKAKYRYEVEHYKATQRTVAREFKDKLRFL